MGLRWLGSFEPAGRGGMDGQERNGEGLERGGLALCSGEGEGGVLVVSEWRGTQSGPRVWTGVHTAAGGLLTCSTGDGSGACVYGYGGRVI